MERQSRTGQIEYTKCLDLLGVCKVLLRKKGHSGSEMVPNHGLGALLAVKRVLWLWRECKTGII